MSSFLGFGTAFYGKKSINRLDKSFITIKWIIFGLLPIVPLKIYRVIRGETKGNISIVISATTSYEIIENPPLKENINFILFTYFKIYGGIISLYLAFKYPILFLVPLALIIIFFIEEKKT